MSIVSGYKKFKKYILTSSGFQLVSHWTNANTLQFDDGKTAQAKLGAIDCISSSKDSSSDKIAASTKLVSELNSNLSQIQIYVGDDDKLHFIDKDGADTALNFTPKKTITVSTYINSWTWRCYAVTSINGKEVCRVETTNPGDTSTNSNTNTVSTTI